MKVIRIARCTECPFLAYTGPCSPSCTKTVRYLTEDEIGGIPKDCPLEEEKEKEPRWKCGNFNEADF